MSEEQTSLIPVENVNAQELFKPDSELLPVLLNQIKEAALAHVPDVSTEEGRKAIASNAYKVARSKTTIDNAGKELVAGIKAQSAVIDKRRKHAWDFLEGVQKEARAALNEWEAEEARKAEEERQAAELELLHMEALRENELFDREAEVKRQQDELAKLRAEQDERDRQAAQEERDRKLKEESEERGRQQAAAALECEKQAREQAEQRAKDAAEKAESDKAAAVEAERKRLEKEAADREAARLAQEEADRLAEEKRAANTRRRNNVRDKILLAFREQNIPDVTSIPIIELIDAGKIPHMSINY